MKMFGKNVALLAIDLQNAFMPSAAQTAVVERVIKFADNYETVLFTRYVNSKWSPCRRFMDYTDCDPGSEGIELCSNVCDYIRSHLDKTKIFDKGTYSAMTNELLQYLNAQDITEIHIVGFDTGCCVTATAYAFFDKGFRIQVIGDLCESGISHDLHEKALSVLCTNVPVTDTTSLTEILDAQAHSEYIARVQANIKAEFDKAPRKRR